MERPKAEASSQDTRTIKISKNERDWLAYISELLSRDVPGEPGYGFRISHLGDQKLGGGGKENMIRRCEQIIRRYDKAGSR